eukprot:SAG31_NODE_24777_length_474_cov_0.946667_2_plen_91_part_01
MCDHHSLWERAIDIWRRAQRYDFGTVEHAACRWAPVSVVAEVPLQYIGSISEYSGSTSAVQWQFILLVWSALRVVGLGSLWWQKLLLFIAT